MSNIKIVCILSLSLLLLTQAGSRRDALGIADKKGSPLPKATVSWAPETVQQGGVVRFFADLPEGLRVTKAEISKNELHFVLMDDTSGRWVALYGVDAEKKPGLYDVTIRLSTMDGKEDVTVKEQLWIQPRDFGREDLTLPDSKVKLSEESLKRVRREGGQIAALWPRITPEQLWDGPFLIPVTGRPGSPFGLRRWINGERRSYHSGMVIKSPEGTPVRASNSGRVVLTGDHFFGGNSVFVDHGLGLYTMYFHLSKIDVEPGQEVLRGQTLGRVGSTGRSTGPHLHWGVRLGGAKVDPKALIENSR